MARRKEEEEQLGLGGGRARPKTKIGRRPHMFAADWHEFADWLGGCEAILGADKNVLVSGRVPSTWFYWANGWTPEEFINEFCQKGVAANG
jgi:hypothetical protein